MNTPLKILLPILLLLAGAGGWLAYQKHRPLEAPGETMGYSIGVQVGRNLQKQSVALSAEAVGRAINDVLKDRPLKLTDEEMNVALRAYQEASVKAAGEMAEKRKVENLAFFKTNGSRKEVTTLPSGLQFEVLKPATGKKIKATDTVMANYRGTLTSGEEFDSSARVGKLVEFELAQLIPGLQIGIPQMEEGSVYRFFVPPSLAYGSQARPGIPAESILIFEFEAVKILEKPKAAGLKRSR
jgi:FKBP-type peptidyl-prolyl cis-trans isomerase FklB